MISQAASEFQKLDTKRSGVLKRARDCSALTIPHLLPPDGHNEQTELFTPYQGLGARGVNNLSSKLLLALLPPNAPFFRLTVDDTDVANLAGDAALRTKVETALGEVERTVMSAIEHSNSRTVLFETLKHLVACGNALLFQEADGQLRMWNLSQYVVLRDYMGDVLKIIIKETVSPATLDEETKLACEVNKTEESDKNVDVYTVVLRGKNRWEVHQEINDIVVPGSTGSYPMDEPAYLALRLSSIAGEDYGRGLVEEYLGDLRSLEGLTKSIVIASAAAAKVLFFRDPNASSRAKDIAQAASGDVLTGREGDISVLQLDKYPDFKVALEVAGEIGQRLSQSFLLNTAVQRNAERVTAEEIRYVAQELEDALGGIYSILTQELQIPFVNRRMSLLRRQGKLPRLPKDVVKPVITAGLEALGRGHDISKLRALLEDIAPLGEETIRQYLNVGDYIQRASNARGIDSDGLVRTEEQVQQALMQQQMQQLMQGAGPGVVQEMMKTQTQGGQVG